MYLNLTKHSIITNGIVTRGETSLTLSLTGMTRPAYVTVLIFRAGYPVGYFTTDDYVMGGNITVRHYEDMQDFSIYTLSARDGFSNGGLGTQNWGIYFERLYSRNATKSNPLSTSVDIYSSTSYVIQVPFKTEEYEISYSPIGTSVTELGEVQI